MSRHSFTINSSHYFAELEVDSSRIVGTGESSYPYLCWQMELILLPQSSTETDYVLKRMDAELFLSPGPKITDARPCLLQRIARGTESFRGTEYLNFEFPLDVRRIEAIEQHRKGGSLKLRLQAKLHVEELGIVEIQVQNKRQTIWGLRKLHCLFLPIDIQIDQAHWIEKVLPGVSYGKVHVVEFPAVPLAACAALDHSFKALTQAAQAHREGRYDDAAGKCRVALDQFFEIEERTESDGSRQKFPVLKKAWQSKVSKSTFEWMTETLTSIKIAGNPAHHSPNAHFDQLESQMFLAVTTALVSHAARMNLSEKDLK